jgi:predicted GNAT family N-acyltransferase
MGRPDSLHFEQLTSAQVQPLRTRILRPHFEAGQICAFPRDDAPDTAHFGIVDDAAHVYAVATFIPNACPELPGHEAIQLRGMCVDRTLQGQGLGERLLDGSLTRLAVQHSSAEILWCNARTSAAGFYEKMGFAQIGEVFDVEHIGPHVVMWRKMPMALA